MQNMIYALVGVFPESFTISNKKEEMEKVRQSVDFTEGNTSTIKI